MRNKEALIVITLFHLLDRLEIQEIPSDFDMFYKLHKSKVIFLNLPINETYEK